MRLPLVPSISTKDGTSNKNARLTNALKESKKSGDVAVVRPGLVLDAQASGVGNGLVVFNDELVSIYGATLAFGDGDSSVYELTEDTFSGRGAINISSDSWAIYGYNSTTLSAEVYSGNSSGTMSLNSAGFETTNPSNQITASSMASSGTSIVIAKDKSLQYSVTGGSFSFTTKETLSGASNYYRSVKYIGGKYVAVSRQNSSSQSTIRWSNDNGVTWGSWDDPNTDLSIFDVTYDGSSWWFFYEDQGSLEIAAKTTTDFVTFNAQVLSGIDVFSDLTGYSAAYGGGFYYLSHTENDSAYFSHYSSDGLNWTGMIPVTSFTEGRNLVFGISQNLTVSSFSGDTIVSTSGYLGEMTANTSIGMSKSTDYPIITTEFLSRLYGVLRDPRTTVSSVTSGTYDFAQSPL